MKCPVEIAQEISVWRVKEKKITWQAAEKMAARRAVEKTRGGKVKKPTFPPRLEIPQTPRDSHFAHSPDDYGRLTKNRTLPFLRKGDTSNVVTRGTFLMSVDNNDTRRLTKHVIGRIM
jgi:hypothetical protein